jgi:6-phosphogluconolactonase
MENDAMADKPLVYVGTYSEPILFGTGQVLQGQGKGIYAFHLDAEAGALVPQGITAGVRNSSYLAFDPARRFLYCVNEFKEFEGEASGAVSSFRIDPQTGALAFLNMKASRGTDPCHLIVDATGRNLLIANFASGSVCVLPVGPDGTLGDASDFKQHIGSSVDPKRQAGPHAHAVAIDNGNRFAFVPDLGLDKVVIYRFDPASGRLEANDRQPWIATAPGAGPRQLVFHPSGQFAYLINELNSTMTAYRYDPESGVLDEFQTLPTLPADFTGHSTCAEVQIHPSGRYLYGSNRGHDSIVIYALDGEGRMSLVGHEGTRGKIPRNFEVSPDGRFLAAANQDSNNVVMFRIDAETGKLAATGNVVEAGTPICVRFKA